MNLKRNLRKIEKEFVDNFEEIEDWVVERRKFFYKLGFVVLFVCGLLLFSHIFLTR